MMWLYWIFSNDSHSVKIQIFTKYLRFFKVWCQPYFTVLSSNFLLCRQTLSVSFMPLYFFIGVTIFFIYRYSLPVVHLKRQRIPPPFSSEFSFFSYDAIDFHIYLYAFFIFFMVNVVCLLSPPPSSHSISYKLWWARTVFSSSLYVQNIIIIAILKLFVELNF